jgi:hypothetical protein
MSKDSMLIDLHKLLEVDAKDKNYFSHMLLALEVNEDGTPIGAVVKMKCSPILALGVIDLLHEKLSEARETVIEELNNYEKANMGQPLSEHGDDFESMIKEAAKNITEEDKEFFMGCQKRALAALMQNDEETLKSVIAEMRAYVDSKKKKRDGDSGDFNLNDFKGSF